MYSIITHTIMRVPIRQAQFDQLDILMLTLPHLRIVGLSLDHDSREVTILWSGPPHERALEMQSGVMYDMLTTLEASADYDDECACHHGESCPACQFVNASMVYCWARRYFAKPAECEPMPASIPV